MAAKPMMPTPAPPKAAPPQAVVAPPADRRIGYLEASGYPLTALSFVAPLLVVYEAGTRQWASDPVSHVQQRIVAFNLMQQFFDRFGITGQWFPAFAVASILVAWHLARGDAWAARLTVLLGMAVESAMYAVPLVALGYAFQHYLPPLYGRSLPVVTLSSAPPNAMIVLSIGAGVYEELVFRLIAFAVLSFLLVDVLRMPKLTAVPIILVTSAVAFSLYHYKPCGIEPFQWESFAFRTMAGAYFGVIFAGRGFGITVGAHAAYDVTIVLLKAYAAG